MQRSIKPPVILLFGKTGQVGSALQQVALPGQLISLGRHQAPLSGDFTAPAALAATIHTIQPDVIINAAAYTAVDKAESEPTLAHQINCDSVAVLANEAKKIGALLVHYSSDYIFDGSGSHFRQEMEEAKPLNVYGKTKLAAEQAIINSGCRHVIFRTSWVYSATGNQFIQIILNLAQNRDTLSVVDDQFGAPTHAAWIAEVTSIAIQLALNGQLNEGIYHLAASGVTTWYHYAAFILGRARQRGLILQANHLTAIKSKDYQTKAQRPLNSRLNTAKLQHALSLTPPFWQIGVNDVLEQELR